MVEASSRAVQQRDTPSYAEIEQGDGTLFTRRSTSRQLTRNADSPASVIPQRRSSQLQTRSENISGSGITFHRPTRHQETRSSSAHLDQPSSSSEQSAHRTRREEKGSVNLPGPQSSKRKLQQEGSTTEQDSRTGTVVSSVQPGENALSTASTVTLAHTLTPRSPRRSKRGHGAQGNISWTETSISDTVQKDAGQSNSLPHKRQKTKKHGREPTREQNDTQNVEESAYRGSPTGNKVSGISRRAQRRVEYVAAEIVEEAVQRSSKDGAGKRKKLKRSVTPEDAESMRIAPSEVRMADLCKDNRIGKKSAREQELCELERAAFVKKKQQQLKEVLDEGNTAELPGSVGEGAREGDDHRDSQEDAALDIPNTIIVNGEIQIDESSLRIDRHAAAAIEREAQQLEGVEENEFSRKITSGSWLKRDRSGGWNQILLDRLYDGLRMFGTDFGLISKMFPGKSRHAIKLKFCKEERDHPARIKAVLLGENMPVDLAEFQKLTETEYRDPKVLEEEMEEDRKALEEEQAAEKEAMEKARKERAEQAAAERDASAAEESSSKENRKRSKRESARANAGKGPRARKTGMEKARKGKTPERRGATVD